MNNKLLQLLSTILTAAILISESGVASAGSEKLMYTCKGERVVGFDARKGNGWQPTTFNDSGQYTISLLDFDTDEYPIYSLIDLREPPTMFGDRRIGELESKKTADIEYAKKNKQSAENSKKYPWLDFSNRPFVVFNSAMKVFALDRKTLKFTNIDPAGYLLNNLNSTISMEIGSCTEN